MTTSLQPTLQHKDCDPNFFPNIHRVLCQMLLCPVTSAGVERANSSLRYIKNVYRSTMTEDRLNALILYYLFTEILNLTMMQLLIRMAIGIPTECCLSTLYHSEIFYDNNNLSK